jgi:hypothetical protein
MRRALWLVVAGLFCALPTWAQQTGSISGRVATSDGQPLPGVVVEASSNVLPRPRVTTTGGNGNFTLPQLPPGTYQLSFALGGMGTVSRELRVQLQQESVVNVVMSPEAVSEEITVVGESPLIDLSSPEIKSGLDNESFEMLPVGQDYRDLVKLIPGVPYSEESVRGPSAGGSGQDNIYQFDGVSVNLPLFGTLSSEPSSHDIAQIAVVKGGAKAVDFNRSGGFTIDSVSKSGTNQYHGEVKYQLQTEGMTGDRKTSAASPAIFDEDRDWMTLALGGPAVRDRLYFYGSFFRPTTERENRSNLYGEVPDFKRTRDELFGKLTFTPSASVLLQGSYRDSDRDERGAGVTASDTAGTVSRGNDSEQRIGILEGSWVISERSFASVKLTDFDEQTSGQPDRFLGFPIRIDGTVGLDVNNLDQQGLFQVPTLGGNAAYNARVAPLIDRYGYLLGGQRVGGGLVGVSGLVNDQDFFRQSFQVGYDYLFGDRVTHEVHVGYQWFKDEEDLARTSNGWGLITVPETFPTNIAYTGTPFYQARFHQMTLQGEGGALIPSIRSELVAHNIEINDTIKWQSWTFNVGVLLSNDIYYGQGLRPNSSNPVSGFETAPGHKYKMHEVDFEDMIQPRVGAVWAYAPGSTLYANYARYNPAASSLPRAASWDRNLAAEINAYFDVDGNLVGHQAIASSSGKWFQDGIKPRAVEEYLLGTSRQITSRWAGRLFGRYRHGIRFWEDTNNNARVAFAPPPGIPQELYVPNLDQIRGEIGGSTYVIAQLDDAFTKYYEVSLESEWRGDRTFVRGSYVWSQYYGNFDQDNTTTGNDDNIFIGSSFLADGAGRQVWDNRYGWLRGDRRHQVKLYGFYRLPWNASAGAYGIYQSGQPWEAWSFTPYTHLTTSTSNVSRFAEPAGSRRTSDHYQVDLNYTQNFTLAGRYTVQLIGDLFNLFDKQTGYDIQNQGFDVRTDPPTPSATFGEPRRFFNPRRFQLAVRFQF